MSILDHIPEPERASVVSAIVAERPFEPASANEVALRWCVMKLQGELAPSQKQADALEAQLIEQLQAELEAQRTRAEGLASALDAGQKAHRQTVREKLFIERRRDALNALAGVVRAWVLAYGSADQSDIAVQNAFHDTKQALDAIDAEERKP